MSWPTDIPRIKDGITSFTEADINPIIDALETRTTLLKQNIINDSIINGTGFSDIGLDGCIKGQFVSYSTKNQKYVPAQPVWNESNELPSDEACVVGLVISDVHNDQGTILTSGIIRNSELLTHIMNNNSNIPGNYYLKSNGYITANIDEINFPIHCGTLTASGCFVLGIQVPDFRTHNHTSYSLNPNYWSTSVGSTAVTAPVGSVMVYDTTQDISLKNVLRSYLNGLALVINGQVLKEYKDYEVSNGYIWVKRKFDTPIEGTLYATNPFMGVAPWLNALTTAEDESRISVKTVGSTAILSLNFPVTEKDDHVGRAISNITPQGVEVTPVVSDIVAGPGITVVKEPSTGIAQISTVAYASQYVEMNVVNGNGIVYGGTESCLFKFPAGRPSSIVGTVRAPNSNKKFKARVFMYIDGSGSSAISASCNIHAMSIPVDGTISTASYSVAFTNPQNTGAVVAWTSNEFTVDAGTLLNISIHTSGGSNNINVRALGAVFENIV